MLAHLKILICFFLTRCSDAVFAEAKNILILEGVLVRKGAKKRKSMGLIKNP